MSWSAGTTPQRPRRHFWTRTRQVWLWSLVMGLSAAGIAIGLERLDRVRQLYWSDQLGRKVYDLAFYLARKEKRGLVQEPRVVLLDIDNQTLTAVHARSPSDIDRSLHARLIDRLRELGARVITFDLVFNPETPEDPALITAMKRHGKVVVGAEMRRQMSETGNVGAGHIIRSPTYCVPDIRDAGYSGFVTIPEDVDGTIRRFEWYDLGLDDNADEQKQPTLAPAACALYLGGSPLDAIRTVDRGSFCGHRVDAVRGPRDRGGLPSSSIDFVGGAGEGFPTISYADLLGLDTGFPRGRSEFPEVRDALMIVGDASGVSQDVHQVPVFSEKIRTGKMPGVQIQANIAHTVLSGRYIRTASPRAELCLLVIACLATVLLTRRLNALLALLVTGGVLAATFWASIIGMRAWAYWLDPVRASVGVIFAYGLEMMLLQVAERRQQKEVRGLFGRHVGAAVMEDLLREDRPPALGGEPREITLLFSDLQGFTTISEQMPPRRVVGLLNEYFEVMLQILDKYGGTVDKLMGDGIMAYFGAPVPQPDHARRAVACALEMQEAMDDFRRDPRRALFPPLHMRIGIHTGEAVVGRIGTLAREEYSVIGDVVNVASRLEGLNKEFGTTILMSDETCQAAQPDVPVQFRGETSVRGRLRAVRVYSIGAPQPAAASTKPP
jgi:adenylate cyclase